MLVKNNDDILNNFENEKEIFKKELECVLCKLNKICSKKVKINDISQDKLLLLFIENKKLKISNVNNFLEKNKNLKEITLSLVLGMISLAISIIAGTQVSKIFKLEIHVFTISLVILIAIVAFATLCWMILFFVAYLKPIIDGSNKIINNNDLISNHSFIKLVIEELYI